MKNGVFIVLLVVAFCFSLVTTSQTNPPQMDTLSVAAPSSVSVFPEISIEEQTSISLISAWEEEDCILPMPPPPPEPIALVAPAVPVKEVRRDYRVVMAKVTAYCPCARCCGVMRGITSTQSSAWVKGVAVDPRAIPYGTLVEVEGYGKFRADDTGGAMRRMYRRHGIIQVDVRMKYHWSAQQWGVRWMKVKVYE